ncbi:MAG TPA: hypothetical protein VKZ18_27395 [Polyangia bacterium]|nr:hypothetical protein [Polyangia bacterium]
MPGLIVLVLSVLATGAPVGGGWAKIYETPDQSRWISAVWLAKDGSWRAASNNRILTGDARTVRTTELGAYDVYAFGEDAAGDVLAVGSRQAIWEEKPEGWKRVHERPGPEPRGRAAHHDILEGVGYFDAEHPDRLLAFASTSFALWRAPDGAWTPADGSGAAQRAVEGPRVDLPKGCAMASWGWLDRSDGFLRCQDGRGFAYAGTARTLSPLARMPAECRRDLPAVTRAGTTLFAACGAEGRIWQSSAGADRWTPLPAPAGVRLLQARNGCLLAATKRAVYRRCAER